LYRVALLLAPTPARRQPLLHGGERLVVDDGGEPADADGVALRVPVAVAQDGRGALAGPRVFAPRLPAAPPYAHIDFVPQNLRDARPRPAPARRVRQAVHKVIGTLAVEVAAEKVADDRRGRLVDDQTARRAAPATVFAGGLDDDVAERGLRAVP